MLGCDCVVVELGAEDGFDALVVGVEGDAGADDVEDDVFGGGLGYGVLKCLDGKR